MSLFTRTPRPVTAILGDITTMVSELQNRAVNRRDQAAGHAKAAADQLAAAAVANEEANLADRVATRFSEIVS